MALLIFEGSLGGTEKREGGRENGERGGAGGSGENAGGLAETTSRLLRVFLSFLRLISFAARRRRRHHRHVDSPIFSVAAIDPARRATVLTRVFFPCSAQEAT